MDKPPNGLQSAKLLTNIFGYWPSFHDAEVLRFSFNRSGEENAYGPIADAVVHVFEMTNEVSPNGYYLLKNHLLVTFRFVDAVQIEFADFNHQNALFGLNITNIADRQMERIKFDVKFSGSFGLEAAFQCFAIEVTSVEPCDAEGNAIKEAA